MIYTWKCKKCQLITETDRKVAQYNVPPDECQHCKAKELVLVILKPPSVPFKHLAQNGVFADDNGTFAPRSI
jgi:NAD-dependent SIR2 family protein deacetylase